MWVAETGPESPAAAFHGIRLACAAAWRCRLLLHRPTAVPAAGRLQAALVPSQSFLCRCVGPHSARIPQGMALTAAKRSEEAWPLLETGLSAAIDNYNLHVRQAGGRAGEWRLPAAPAAAAAAAGATLPPALALHLRRLTSLHSQLNTPLNSMQLKELEKLMPMAADRESLKEGAPSQADDEATLDNLRQQRLVRWRRSAGAARVCVGDVGVDSSGSWARKAPRRCALQAPTPHPRRRSPEPLHCSRWRC